MGDECREVNQKWHSIREFTPSDDRFPFTSVTIDEDEVFAVNKESSWEIDRVFTDYRWDSMPHEVFVVVFKRKEGREE